MSPKYWSTLSLLVFVLVTISLIDISISLKLFDFSFVAEFKALLTVIFSFAASSLLLSFVWLIQKGPLYASWPTLNGNGPHPASIHLRGRSASSNSQDENQANAIRTVSFAVDLPPNYETALSSSKPIDKDYLDIGKIILSHEVSIDGHHNANQLEVNTHSCQQHSLELNQVHSNECQICTNTTSSNKMKESRSHNVAQTALSIVRGFASLEALGSTQRNQIASHDDVHEEIQVVIQDRKLSLCQLDVNQLQTNYGSPPKYSDLLLGSLASEINQNTLFNKSKFEDGY